MLCDLCSAIETNKRNASGHNCLVKTEGLLRQKMVGQASSSITKYKCSKCNHSWQYEDDKNDNHAGWTAL